MSKRGPQSSLNHLNWNETDEPEEKGEFTKASDDVLKQRVIKKARRRVATDDADSTAPSASASVFGAFKGFASTPLAKSGADKPGGGGAQSFSFLSTLGAAKTNGNGTATVSSSGAAADGGGGGAAKPAFSFGSNAGTMAASDASKKMFAFGSPTSLKADSTAEGAKTASSTSSGFGISSSKEGDAGKGGFGFGAASSAPAQPFSFGTVPPKATEAAKPNNNFTFGTLAGGKDSSTDAAPKPTFSFGSFAAKPDGETEKKSIQFGSPTASKEPTTTGTFSFGSNAAKADANSSSTDKKGFAFGSSPAATPKGTSIVTPSGVIKTPVTFGSDAPEADKKPFTFGSPAGGTKESAASSPAASKGMFSFGTNPAKTAPSETPERKTFTFGSPAAAAAAVKSTAVTSPDTPKATFSFGSNATKADAEPGSEKKATFSFGTAASGGKDSAAGISSSPKTSTFSFGSKAPEAEKKTFSFGVPAGSTSDAATAEKSKASFAPPKGTSDDAIKKMFSFASSSSSSSSQPAASSSTSKTDSEKEKAEKKQSTKPLTEADKQTVIRNNVVALNKAFIAWITEKCRENPYCKLHPVFRDYEKQFDEIQAMSPGKTVEKTAPTTTSQAAAPENKVAPAASEPAKPKEPEKEMPKPGFFFGGSASAATAAKESPTKPSSGFTFGSSSKPFSFGTLASSTSASTNATTTTPSIVSTSSSSFFAGASTFAAKSATGGFTFGGVVSKPPAPDSSAAGGGPEKPASGDAEADEDEPPKVEFTPVEEKDSVYSKRCKLFVKVGASYSDRGVGTLHIKMVDAKVQVLVRADTSLGNILLNIILNESVPVQRLGKNNVMMICLPTPDAKPPPTSVLLRVKTGEEADELLATLLKYKPK
ncbi:nuclear pore complex protein Nup50 [Anopheles arabiensis]|uniref:Uncharacterized protein n=1 Tax=Anopheles arabiensis TaxID=7173 RepID=A0A182IB87_ANOAR|nr:nuclear pore complex protein Nup50 [Anopheles arabiensis]